jgi:hypothetical protein
MVGPAEGRGLPPAGDVQHEVRRLGAITFQADTASVGGAARFVNYTGGDGAIYTAFQVAFAESVQPCIAAAEVILGTLSSVHATEATPIGAP